MRIEKIIGGSIGTNCYVIVDQKDAILVDFVPEVESFLTKNSLKVTKVLLTHIHFDHFEMLSLFQSKFGFELVLSEKAYKNINDPNHNLLFYVDDNVQIEPVNLDCAKIVKEGDVVEFNGYKIAVLETPGHSEDSLVYSIESEKSIFSGDTLFKMTIGRTDLPSSNYDLMVDSLKRIFQNFSNDYTVYPGHGEKTTIGFERINNPFLDF